MAAPGGIGNLSTLIKRLEAATSRLEDLAQTQLESGGSGGPGSLGAALGAAGLGAGAGAIAGGAASSASAPPAAAPELPAAVEAWDETVSPSLQAFLELSARIGGLVATQSESVRACFTAQRSLVHLAASCAKPADGGLQGPTFAKALGPLQQALVVTQEVKEKNRAERKLFNHLSAIAEGIPAVGWVAIEPKPAPYVGEMKDSAQFYLNRVIKEFKDQGDEGKTHVEWCRAFGKLLESLQAYVKDKHTTGLVWNPKGGDAATFQEPGSAGASASSAPAAPAGGAAPPPPPPPPAPPIGVGTAAAAGAAGGAAAAGGGMGAVFSQLNQGEGITKALKKVDSSQQTHKNPELRGTAPVPDAGAGAGAKAGPPKIPSKPATMRAKKPAKTALEGNKWMIEYHEDNRSIVIDQTELSHTVNIFNCKNCTIQVRGKVNAVSMVSCSKTSVLVDTLVSSFSITSSPSFTVQITGRTPTVLIDTTDSGQLYLSKESLDAEIVTAKSSAINISTPLAGGEEGEFVEHAIPEQMKHVFKDGKFVTEIVAHSG